MKQQQTNTTVVKLGGSLLDDATLRGNALAAIAAAWNENHNLVVVHGGGKHVDAMMRKVGLPKQTVGGLRVTDDATLPMVVSVLAGIVNKQLVSELHRLGVSATGISGADGESVMAELHPNVEGTDLGWVGQVTEVNPELIRTLVAVGFLPLVGSIAMHSNGALLNVNADAVAAAVAKALGASRLVFMTDVEGVKDEEGRVIEQLGLDSTARMLFSPAVTGGMRPKLESVLSALQGGVQEVVIAGPDRHATVLVDGKGGTHLVAA
jgi:acetylglutamate kinase